MVAGGGFEPPTFGCLSLASEVYSCPGSCASRSLCCAVAWRQATCAGQIGNLIPVIQGAPLMATPFNHEDSLTHEEIQLRFKKIMGREMTPKEKKDFFLPLEAPTESGTDEA